MARAFYYIALLLLEVCVWGVCVGVWCDFEGKIYDVSGRTKCALGKQEKNRVTRLTD